jgi:hypothetical protein
MPNQIRSLNCVFFELTSRSTLKNTTTRQGVTT